MDYKQMGWHSGEDQMHKLLHVPPMYNPTSPGLSPHSQRLLHISSLLAIGVVDEQGRPWTTLLGGKPGFVRSLGQSIVGVKALADTKYDPVLDIMLRKQTDLAIREEDHLALDFSALAIHLATRDRVKLNGKLLGVEPGSTEDSATSARGQTQLALAVMSSLGNCPKYINKKDIVLRPPNPKLISDTLPLSEPALALLAQADIFFITSSQPGSMSTNDRGGPRGFIRVEKNDHSGCILVYPEYSGNRLYQTLGNLYLDPRAGLAIPDFSTGNILYLTCTTKILFGADAVSTLPRSNLAVQLLVSSARLVEKGLGFKAIPGEASPYNPPVRYLPHERANMTDAQAQSSSQTAYAKLLSRKLLTPSIARFKFSISDPKTAGHWTPGQYVALAFEDELSGGYAHMNDEDPRSLNDDFVRTFTVSSPPYASGCGGQLQQDEFEVTIRNVGKATDFLFKVNLRMALELPLRGFAGTFAVEQKQGGAEVVPFVAGGIGITPLLAQMRDLDLTKLKLFWTVNARDLGLVADTLQQHPALAPSTTVFISGNVNGKDKKTLSEIEEGKAKVVARRMLEKDITNQQTLGETWYICTGPGLRKSLLGWLKGKTTIYEDFDY